MIHAESAFKRNRWELPHAMPRCYCSTTREGITIVTKACRELTEAQERRDAFSQLPFEEQMAQLTQALRNMK